MDTILKVIDGVTKDKLVKDIINSLNENQEKSKSWLIEKSKEYFSFFDNPSVVIAAGWYGHLASKIKKNIKGKVVTFDRDFMCKKIGQRLYKDEGIGFEFGNIETFNIERFDIVICTSSEHLKQKVLDDFLKRRKKGSLVILQSNNYFYDPENKNHVKYRLPKEHINCHNSLKEFEKTLRLDKILYSGTLKLDKFDRYMVIGI